MVHISSVKVTTENGEIHHFSSVAEYKTWLIEVCENIIDRYFMGLLLDGIKSDEERLEEEFHLEPGTLKHLLLAFQCYQAAEMYLKDEEVLETLKGEHEIKVELDQCTNLMKVSIGKENTRIILMFFKAEQKSEREQEPEQDSE